MIRNFSKEVLSYNGKAMKENVTGENGVTTQRIVRMSDVLGPLLFFAGSGNSQGSTPLSPDEKWSAYKLTVQLANSPSHVNVDGGDIELIKKLASGSLASGIYGQIVAVLEEKQP
jgi:hypothetical protein